MPTNPNDSIQAYDFADPNLNTVSFGLTKREFFAALALQGIESSNFETAEQGVISVKAVAERAVNLADALIVELCKGEK